MQARGKMWKKIAGGLGKGLDRLPGFPKPLFIGESSVLETQILSLKEYGVIDIIIATNFLSDYIQVF